MGNRKILYIGVGNPSKPRNGMDLVLEAHLDEISTLSDADLVGLFVSPMPNGDATLQPTRWSPRITAFRADTVFGMPDYLSLLQKALFILCGGFLPAYEFKSKEARHFICRILRERPDCIIIDHFYSLVNIGILQLVRAVVFDKCRLVYIAHDATPILLRDIGRLKGGLAARLIYVIQSMQAWLVEVLLFQLASLVVFLSTFDQAWYSRWGGSRTLALCPLIRRGELAQQEHNEPFAPQFLFVGAPDFPPNAFAIRWICTALAPQLFAKSPQVLILLAGKGVEKLPWAIAPNIKPLGFVREPELLRLLDSSAGIVCPIAHGSGLKIKILEALSSGCPVFATEESLHGFEFMQVPPLLRLDDVEITSSLMAQFAADLDWQRKVRTSIAENWAKYVEFRQLALAKSIQAIWSGVGFDQYKWKPPES
jgi:glycosyltransferase involved in cell wall biosynthesis